MTATIIQGNALALPLEDESVDLCITSPPYFGLRSYQDDGAHYDGQLGSEATPVEFVDALIAATAEMVRVLRPSGSIWVNLGDKYAGSNGAAGGGGRSTLGGGSCNSRARNEKHASKTGGLTAVGAPVKSLIGIPWRYALRCIDDLGLILRAEVIWAKPNGLPESVTDRVRRSHEVWFHFTREPRYFSAVDEIREAHDTTPALRSKASERAGGKIMANGAQGYSDGERLWGNPLGKLPGSVWTIPTQPLTVPAHLGVDHFAAFPMEWPRRIIRGWSPSGVCVACGQGRRPIRGVDWSRVPHRVVEKRALTINETAEWCSRFADWCASEKISRSDLDAAAGTSDMGGWWASRLRHRSQIPTPEQWAKISAKFDTPADFDILIHSTRLIPIAERDIGDDVATTGRHRTTGGGLGEAVMRITGYACACPDTTAPTRPSTILDPFSGTGTTALVAHALGRHGIGVDMSSDYCRLARWRTTDPAQLAAALQVDKPEPARQTESLFDLWDGEAS